MANPLNLPGDLVVPGDIRVSGSITPALTKANILEIAELQSFPVPLTSFRIHNAIQTLLPGTPLVDDLGIVGVFSSATPSLRTEDLQGAGANTSYARAIIQLPWEYVAGQSVTLRFMAGMITTAASVSATLDCQAYKQQDDPDDAIGADLCSAAVANNMNSTTFDNIDFVISPTSLSPGDIIDMRVSTAVNDAAGVGAVIAGITSVKLLCDVR